MSICYYTRGEHPSSFVGFVVTSRDGRKRLFSTEHIPLRSSDEFRLQQLLAERQELDWEIERLESRYQRFVTTDDPDTPSAHRVGVHRLTADFYQDGKGVWKGCFTVAYKKTKLDTSLTLRRFPFTRLMYSKAWREAVGCWARQYRIRKADAQRILQAQPPAGLFKELRWYLNDQHDLDIPTTALSCIFREQREALAKRSRAKPATQVSEPEKAPEEAFQSTLAQEIQQWLQGQPHAG